MSNKLTFKNGEDVAQIEIQEKGFDLELWNEFIDHPDDFESLFSKVLNGRSPEFINGYRSYYSSYALFSDTKSYRDDLPDWRFPEGRKNRQGVDSVRDNCLLSGTSNCPLPERFMGSVQFYFMMTLRLYCLQVAFIINRLTARFWHPEFCILHAPHQSLAVTVSPNDNLFILA